MTESHLPHADYVQTLLRAGEVEEAKRVHNEHVDAELARAKQGDTINLSDLMAGKEELVVHEMEKS